MSDTPTVVELDCSLGGLPSPEFVDQVRAEALARLEEGKLAEAANVMRQAQEAHEASKLEQAVARPMTAEEQAQHAADQAEAAELAAVVERAGAEREQLVAKLAQGKASNTEVQQALAQLLG